MKLRQFLDACYNLLEGSWFFWLGFSFFLLIQIFTNASFQLIMDEAVYWVWSRNLALSYFDHPPLVAYLIALSTLIGGTTEFVIRLPALFCSTLTVLIMRELTTVATQSRATGNIAGWIMISSPVMSVVGMVMTPDSPVVLFCVLGLYFLVKLDSCFLSSENRKSVISCWLVFGTLMGLALLSKYTIAIYAPAVLIAILFVPHWRKQLITPWPWVAAFISFILFLPVLIWNFQHDWLSFKFQLGQGLGSVDGSSGPSLLTRSSQVLEFLGSQIGITNPLLFILGCVAIWKVWRMKASAPSQMLRFFAIIVIVNFLFFLYSAMQKPLEANWPLLTYFPVVPILAYYIRTGKNSMVRRVGTLAILLSTTASMFIRVGPFLLLKSGLASGRTAEVYGWENYGAQLGLLAEGNPVCSERVRYAAISSFYMKGRPHVYVVRSPEKDPVSYDFFQEELDTSEAEKLIFVKSGIYRAINLGFSDIDEFEIECKEDDIVVREIDAYIARRSTE